MRWLDIIKRFAPFFLTFALGLFVASFFVSVSAPSFQFKNRSWKNKREYHRLRYENKQLRERNAQLEREKASRISDLDINLDVPPPPVAPLPPPPPPVRIKVRD